MSIEMICPFCDSKGKIVKKVELGGAIMAFGATCTNPKCDFGIKPEWMYPAGAYHKWMESYTQIVRMDEDINKKAIIPTWRNHFPRKEGRYFIRFPNGGMVMRTVLRANGEWITAYGPISHFPEGSLYYGPIPEPMDTESE